MKVKRPLLEAVRQKALPILAAGYQKRKALRSHSEELLRDPMRVARYKRSSLSPI